MSKTVRTIREYYRVGGERGSKHASIEDAVAAAFLLHAEGNYWSIGIERVTVHEPYDGGVFGEITETVTGSISIPGKAHYTMGTPELSRYHSVNGWSIPSTITIE